MFGSSNPFAQSSSSPFGSQTQSVFGQNNNASSSPFAAKPFGTSSPFGAQTGSSMFGGTSTGVFGAPQASSPFGAQTGSSMFGGNSTGVFGAPQASSPFGAPQASSPFGAPQASSPFGASSQGFGSSTQAFGASSAPAFGNSASPFGGSSNFGQKSFGFSTPQSSPFGSTAQQSQPAFGNSTFASSTPFGASSTPAFGATSTPAFGGFGASSTPAFGSTNTSPFGASSTPSFGASSSPAFGASPSPAFGNSGTAFGNNAFGSGGGFGASSTPAFGASSTPAFGASSTPAFGASSTPAFGSSSTPAFGASSTPSFSFGSSPAFGQSSSSFGSTQSPFGSQGAQASTPMFAGQTNFGVQQGGSRVIPYAPTTEADSGNAGASAGKLQSISAMPVHKDKTHEELRWEDYQRGDKGGQLPAGQSPGGAGFGVPNSQPSLGFGVPNSQPSLFPQSSTNPFSSSVATNPFSSSVATNSFSSSIATNSFAQKAPIATTNFSSPFSQTPTPSVFGSTSSTNTSLFGPSPGFATNTVQPFGSSSTTGFASSPSMFGSGSAQGSSPAFNITGNLNNSQSSPLFSSNPSIGQPSSQFGTSSLFGPTSSPFGQNNNPAFPQTSNFSTPSTGMGSLFPSSSSLTTSNSPFGQSTAASLTSYQSAQPTQPLGGFSLNNFSQTQTANTNGFSGATGSFSQGNFGQVPATTNSAVMQPITVANPFGTLPALPQISIAQGGNSPSIQYGISSMPVVDKPASVRVSPLLTSRHLLQRRVKLPARKYRPGDDGPKVPFFSDEENSNTPRADALFIPRENPRALFIRPVEKEKSAPPTDGPSPLQENGKSSNNEVTNGANLENKNNGGETRDAPPVKVNQKPNGTHENHGGEKNSSSGSPSGAEIESLMPKLHHAEYFTEPRIQELAAKERANPGYCGRVKDFVVGRHGYGSIKFLGETDVRKLDLEMLVQFNNREVIVYMDETKKPPVGQGLNKPAEVTLLNIKCIDKKSGKQLKEGPRVDKYKEMLKRKAEEQGAKFVSFDAANGEWKFSVKHFSSYKLGDEDDE